MTISPAIMELEMIACSNYSSDYEKKVAIDKLKETKESIEEILKKEYSD